MREAERQTRSHLMALFERHGLHPRHMFGQNFLIDLNIIEAIVGAGGVNRKDVVLEVGPGTGSMTGYLACEAGRVVSVEIDRDMFRLASESTERYDNVRLLNLDALKNKNTFAPEVIDEVTRALDEVQEEQGEAQLKLIANLPYSVATPIMSNLIASDLPWTRMVVTIQYEVGLRMRAKPGRSHYGALTVWCQAHGLVEIIRKLKPLVFWPRPKVDSAVVRLVRDPKREATIDDRAFFHDYIRRVFQNRRKLLRVQLTSMYRQELGKGWADNFLAENDLSPTCRAEELDVKTHVRVSNALKQLLTT